jgi:hypothetical protein
VNFRTRDSRFWLTAGAALALVITAAAWLLLISPKRNSTAELRSQAADGEVSNAAMASKIAALAKLDRDPSQLTGELRDALAGLPSDSGLPEFTQQVTAQAAANHVTLTSIAVGAFTAPSGSTTTTTTTTGPAADGTDPAGTTDTTAASGSTTGQPAGVVSIPVTLISDGSATDQLAFLHAIRVTGPRRALITSTDLAAPATTGQTSIDNSSTMTVTLTVFSAVRSAAEQAEYAKLLQG